MLKILKVSGDSLTPEYQEGDFVLIAKIPFLLNHLKPNDVVVFQHQDYGVMIKKIDFVLPGGNEVFVTGTHDYSVDSRRFGPIKKDDLIGKVVWHTRKSQ
jgi:signal peptidase I